METLPSKSIALSLPAREDPRFVRVYDHLVNTAQHVAMRLRVKCAQANGISIFETEAVIMPDPNRPNVVTITARPLAILKP